MEKKAPNTNEVLRQHLPEYDEVPRNLPLANFPTLFQVMKCEHFGSRQAKFIIQLDPISSDSPYHPVVPNVHFARQRERGELPP